MSRNDLERQEGSVSLPDGTTLECGDEFYGPGPDSATWTVVKPTDLIEAQGTSIPFVWLESKGDNRWIEHMEFSYLVDSEEFQPIAEDEQ